MTSESPLHDPLIGAAGFIFQTPVRARRLKGRPELPVPTLRAAAVQRIAAVVARRPEVMVKVSGAARGRQHLREHLAYITRNGSLVAERENGEQLRGREAVKQLAEEWWALRGARRPRNARDTINLVLSMPKGVDRAAVAAAAVAFARTEFGRRFDYVLVHHHDTAHPHAHLTVLNLNDRGQCLNPRKADLQAWREQFANALKEQGIDAAATPRRARGVVHKPVRQTLRHMGKRSDVSRWKIEQALKTLDAAQTATAEGTPAPWRVSVQERHAKVRRAWRTVAQALEAQGEHALALQVMAFIESMPAIRTRQESMQHSARAIVESESLREQAQGRLHPPTPTRGH